MQNIASYSLPTCNPSYIMCTGFCIYAYLNSIIVNKIDAFVL